MSSSLSKRKLDDYAADSISPINPTRMRKDQNALPSSSSSNSPSSTRPLPSWPRSSPAGDTHLQFFVRILSYHSLVVQADSSDTVRSIHEKIESITGISIFEQRLIYRGRQLQLEQTLAECKVQNDASLNLVGRMRSTGYPEAWHLINEVVSSIFLLYKTNPQSTRHNQKSLRTKLTNFVSDSLKDPLRDTVKSREKLSGYLQIFNSSSAAGALVMLYMSSCKTNKEEAEEAIKSFITSIKNSWKHFCLDTVLIVLEFCRLLNKTAGIDDPLYCFCRRTLGEMAKEESIGIANKESTGIEKKKCLIGIHDIFPFVNELASKLSRDLMSSTESTFFPSLSPKDVTDFSTFIEAMKIQIERRVGFGGPIRVPLTEELPLDYADNVIILHGIFTHLLSKLENVLVKIEEHVEWGQKKPPDTHLLLRWYEYLRVLKELNSISKLYYGCEKVFWETMKRRKDVLCYLVVMCAKRKDDNNWILDCKELTNFEARKCLAMFILPEVKDEYNDLHEMLIDRSHLLEESYEYIVHADLDSLRAGLFMEFKNEEATGPGVLREWFFLVCQAIFNPQNALFVACPNDRRRFYPNPASKVDPLHLKYFSFSGKVIALALMHKVQIGIVLDRVFFLQLAGQTITLEDIKDADPYLYNSCKQILEMDPTTIDQDALGLTFIDEKEELGARKVIELCPDGKNVIVNSKNRRRYIDSLIQHRFVTSISEQVAHFTEGFADIMSSNEIKRSFFRCLNHEDLDCMLHGSESGISVEDWRAHTDYHGFVKTDVQISWFWEIVGNMTKEQKKILLFFWTSIKYLPVEGFSGLASRLYIYKTSEPCDRLPSSHTCFYRLCFPAYNTINEMQERLRIITQEHVGCSFGTW
ncbi:hypothetical protein ABFX02_13G132000 [Erythranthe guttata]